MWEVAGEAGLVLGSISSAYLFLTQWLAVSELPAVLVMFLNMLLWSCKSGGCIFLMIFFLKRFSRQNPEADQRMTFKAGMAIAILSGLVYAACSFADLAFIHPDFISEQMDILMQELSPMLDSNTMTSMEKAIQNITPQTTFFSNLIYCFIYGTALSSIISRFIPRQNTPAGYKPEQE